MGTRYNFSVRLSVTCFSFSSGRRSEQREFRPPGSLFRERTIAFCFRTGHAVATDQVARFMNRLRNWGVRVMAVQVIGRSLMTSDQTEHQAKSVGTGGWVVSFLPGRTLTIEQATAAMQAAEAVAVVGMLA